MSCPPVMLPHRLLPALALATAALLWSTSCSVRRFAVNALADALGGADEVFASDEDPELVRDAMPFAMKTMEALIVQSPDDAELLLSACRIFTLYSYAFVETDALLLEFEDYGKSEALKERALGLYLRARDYGLRALEERRAGVSELLRTKPHEAVADFGPRAVPYLYWTAAAWGSGIALGTDRPELVADFDAVRACLRRVLELDGDFGGGAIHEALLKVEALPELMGGSEEKARAHFEKAVEIAKGSSAGPYVALAASVSVPNQDRAEFEALLTRALAVDPDRRPETRLANLIAQRRARHLLEAADELFLELLE